MALVKKTAIDKYEIVSEWKMIQCRHATWVEDDETGERFGGVQYFRHVIAPSDDVSGEPQEVQALVALMHTPEVIAAYEAHVAEEPIKPMKPMKPVKPTWLRSGRVSNV